MYDYRQIFHIVSKKSTLSNYCVVSILLSMTPVTENFGSSNETKNRFRRKMANFISDLFCIKMHSTCNKIFRAGGTQGAIEVLIYSIKVNKTWGAKMLLKLHMAVVTETG